MEKFMRYMGAEYEIDDLDCNAGFDCYNMKDCWDEAYAAGRADQRERDAGVAMEHECGFDDDIVCNHLNCGMLISAAIRKGGE